jgi:hypothetical protein
MKEEMDNGKKEKKCKTVKKIAEISFSKGGQITNQRNRPLKRKNLLLKGL